MNRKRYGHCIPEVRDYGPNPLIANIDYLTKTNQYYRTTLWTGTHLQVTLMSIPVGGDIGLEIHHDVDQFIRVEDGCALVMMGESKNALTNQQRINSDYAVMIPAGTWHNLINAGNKPLKLYSIYAPPQHPFGTVHNTKQDAQDAER